MAKFGPTTATTTSATRIVGGEVGVEDVLADHDLSLAGERVVRRGAVDGKDLVAAPGGEGDEVSVPWASQLNCTD